ncbi:MAG: hypothetical protein LBQ68_08400 [Clostridiales bacterium]|jgi:hypothetical protein|nr:hypothetical protein [Clostridiales bacterium]
MSKKLSILYLLLPFLVIIMCPVTIRADSPITVTVNGNTLSFDVAPVKIDGRIMVPFRAIGEAIGTKTAWDADSRKAWMYQGNQYIGLEIGKKQMIMGRMGGPEIALAMDVAALIIDGRTLVPVRAVSEGLKCEVNWQADTNTVSITSDYKPLPTITEPRELLAVIDTNIEAMNTKFIADTTGIDNDDLILNLTDYFLNLDKTETRRWNYWAGGTENTLIEYNVTYSMYGNVSRALKNKDPKDLSENEKAVYDKVNDVIAFYIQPTMTAYEKEKAIHDYLVNSVSYDGSEQPARASHTPYGALIDRVAVCNGYSDSFKLFMDALGIECDIVYGEVKTNNGNQKHAWNRVKIDGGYYLVDVTWDEPESGFPEYISYDYFNVTDDQMNRDHIPYSTVKASTYTAFNYHVLNNVMVGSQQDVDNVIQRAMSTTGQKVIHMRAASLNLGMISYQVMADYLMSGHALNYYHNPVTNTLVIFLS